MLKNLLEIRTKLILFTILGAIFLFSIKAFAFGGWPFHFPEIEGGVEVTLENMRHDEERKKQREEEEARIREENEKKSDLKYLIEEAERQKAAERWRRCQETGIV